MVNMSLQYVNLINYMLRSGVVFFFGGGDCMGGI